MERLVKKPIQEIELEIPKEELEQQLTKKTGSDRNRKPVNKANAARKNAASGRRIRKRKRKPSSKRRDENEKSS